jgi:hypothetical protein
MGTGEVTVAYSLAGLKGAGVQMNGFSLAIVMVLREARQVRIKSHNKKEWVN